MLFVFSYCYTHRYLYIVYGRILRLVMLPKKLLKISQISFSSLIKPRLYIFYYLGGGLIAVDHLSLGIPHGECFGLLGQNGAGKTSCFKMLTGDETISSGSSYIDSFDVSTNMGKVITYININ